MTQKMETKKLTVKDLMIGDWVYIYKFSNDNPTDLFPAKVVSILQGKYTENYNTIECVYGTDIASRPVDTCLSIPLTTEILEKNGFELFNQDFTSRKVYKFGCFDYIECNDYHENNRYNYFSIGCYREYKHFGTLQRYIHDVMKIKYVHELQHALRLCGVDKEIVL